MRIAVIADSHLAERAPECVHNWHAAAAAVARLGVDLTVHVGDISLDGHTHPEELAYASGLVHRWPTPMHCVPGNHDMGDGSGEAPLDAHRVAACRDAFGPGHWAVSAGAWELLGLDAQLLGSDSAEEDAQWEWLEDHLARRDDVAHRVLFLHRPLVRPYPTEHDRTGRYVADAAGKRLLQGPLHRSLRAVVSGHVHQHLDLCIDGIRHLWMPSSAFVIPDSMQPQVGTKSVGVGLLDLGAPDIRLDLLEPEGMTRHSLVDLAFWQAR